MEEVTDASVDWVRIKRPFMKPLAVFGFSARVCAHETVCFVDLSKTNKVTVCVNAYFEDSTNFLLE